jgi:hypothetical protein
MDHVFRGRVSAGVGWGARAFSGGGSPTKRLRLAAEGRPAAQRGMGGVVAPCIRRGGGAGGPPPPPPPLSPAGELKPRSRQWH